MMAIKSSARGTRRVVWAVLHTAEGARNTTSLRAWFEDPDTIASSHVGIDASSTAQYVPYDRASWTLRNGNPISDNAELCGFARWTRDQWLSTGTVDGVLNPRAMLDRAATWIRERCVARGIPLVLLSAADIRAGRPGVMGHWDYTKATGDGTHHDPGANFPWDYVMSRAAGGNMSDQETTEIARMLWKGGDVPGSVAPGTAVALIREVKAMLWAGGAVPGSVAGGTVVDEVRVTRDDVADVKETLTSVVATQAEMVAKLDQIIAKLDEPPVES